MPAYPFDNRSFHWNPPKPHASGSFRPQGRLQKHGDESWVKKNPGTWSSTRTVVGRLFVGFSVGQTPTWAMDDLVNLIERVRLRQTGNPSASFVAQKGIYQHRDGKSIVHEDGAQVFILNLSGADDDEFQAEMVELAEEIARTFQQEEVIVEIQVNGISQVTIGVEP